ncbi:response regulator transcription factor [Geobacter pelophilus]|uniref:Response regulator transcription factor n=1 Tax=Geoanaerobacter pelophilus TaxID=60036 RepID=A0AAW4L7Q9_9BACT|nr:response regulator transcription factor [Geoanaerobacter pelophilus]MBT0666197.1 response regulator transcription factor [Geoanaerobacter pelophilus]
MARILIIEDEAELAELVALNVVREGHEVVIALSGEEGLEKVDAEDFDLVILDLMMPGLTGFEVCRGLRRAEKSARIPIIMVTACSSEADRVSGLEAGADDYVVKPFSIRELMLRIRAKLQIKQKETVEPTRYHIGQLIVDTERHQIIADHREINLTITEFKLLTCLIRSAGRVLSRDNLLNDVWGDSSEIDHRTIDSYVTRLRTKLGDVGDMVQTIRGFGYKLEQLNQ